MADAKAGGHGDADVVVTGLSGRLPESDNVEEFAEKLFAGVDLVTDDDRRWTPGMYGLPLRSGGRLKDLSHFDGLFFGVHAKLAHVMDPQVRLLFEVVYEAIVDAGVNPAELRGSQTGVYVGMTGTESINAFSADPDKISGYALTGSNGANWISFAFDLNGPSLCIDTACSSSMYAMALAFRDIRAGRCDSAIVAGSNICLNPKTSLHFDRLGMLSPEGMCAAFDESGRGYVRSEAVAAVLLQRRTNARRLYCTVRGARTNNDGYKDQGITYPAGDKQFLLAKETFEEAGLRPQDVSYVEAHGTGTKVGDPEEVNAIADLFCKDRETPLLMGSIKSNMGHSEPAAGVCAIAKVVLAMERGVIPGNLHFKDPNTDIPALTDGRIKVVEKNTTWEGGLVAVNSFGFGGSNAHLIMEGGCGSRPPPAEYPAPRLVLASGRTDEAVERLLRLAAENPRDAELHALMDAVHAHATPRHPRRGYTVLDPACDSAPVFEILESEGEPRPVWFVFSGMGSQWAGMARELLRLPVFAASIARSAAALEPYGVDLQYVIAEAPAAAFDNMINCFVSIAAVQVAMVDVLRELDVRADGIVGHSLGETGCAYADGTLTAAQTVLCAYWRGRCTLEAAPPLGAMAAVGLSWEEAGRRCPEDIEIACHNAPDNVTISGPSASVAKFVEQLSQEGVFARKVNTAGVAFHSKYIAGVAPSLRARLQHLIPEPKPRSVRWLSSSIPQDQWSSDLARLSDAAYHVNNLVSPVLFADVLALVPAHAMLVEVAPHALLHALMRRALPQAAHVPLVRRDLRDSLLQLLAAVGKIYVNGAQPQVSRLYPFVSWPVSRGTPSLSSHIGWDHSTEWTVANFNTAHQTGNNTIEYDLNTPEQAFLAGHTIDRRVLFPATGYLMLVWRTIAKMNKLDIEQAAVVLENLEILRATILTHNAPVQFLVSMLGGSGEFEICEGGEVVVKGTARLTIDPATERVPAAVLYDSKENQEDIPSLHSDDIYKDFRLRGYNYTGVFRGIKSSNARGTFGILKWQANWISFMDSALQMVLIDTDKRVLHLPIRMQHVVIDPTAQREAVAAAATNNDGIPVKRYRNIDVIVSGGVEFRGVESSSAPRSTDIQAPPKLEKFVFQPFETSDYTLEYDALSKKHALTAVIQLVIENCETLQIKLAEPALQGELNSLLLPHVMEVLGAEPALRVTATLVAGVDAAQRYATAMESLGVRVSSKDASDGGLKMDCHLVLGVDVLAQHPALLGALAVAPTAAGFVLLEEPAGILEEPAHRNLLAAVDLTLMSHLRTSSREYLLLRRPAAIPSTKLIVEALVDDYSWIECLRDAMKRAESGDMRVYLWSRAIDSGVQGMTTCLRREPGGDCLRLYYLPGADAFDPEAPAYRAQVRRDLAFNVLRDGIWGTYRHLPLNDTAETMHVEHAYVNTLTRGNLSTLRWIASELRYLPTDTGLCHVYYSALNFRDIMFATGKLAPELLPGDLGQKECLLGFEFSGITVTGKRVMGILRSKGLATTVLANDTLSWEVPKQWSLEEAATVPVAYLTAYYALYVRGHMRPGEAVLVHAGAGGVGLAAIAVALHAGCTVFTTVSSPEKRAFLRAYFPQLPDDNIGNSRNCSFEQLVRERTRGRGVDLVLNSLAKDKLQASLRCLALGGRFLEIGKLDISLNTPLGMAVLLNNRTLHGIFLDMLLELPNSHEEKIETLRYLTNGIASGTVRPLPKTVFADNQLETAFRYLAKGMHIGKVLIRVREEVDSEAAGPKLISAMPRVYMQPSKSYVLVGGLGGFGMELGEWLVERGARTLVLNSRGGVCTGYQVWCLRRWREAGIRVLVSLADATTTEGARALLQAAATIAPIGGIFNLAVVLRDALFENQTQDTFREVAKPKIDATRALDAASRELAPELEFFVAFSSVSCGRGLQGQSNYGFANSAMERLCEQRRKEGLPALAVQWGAVGDVGLVAAMSESDDFEIHGTIPQRIASCLRTLESLMLQPHVVVSSMVLADKQRAKNKPTKGLVHAVANILGISDVTKVSQTTTLLELGMDSMMATEIKQTLQRNYDMPLGVKELRGLTFSKLRELDGATTKATPTLEDRTPRMQAGGHKRYATLSQLIPEEVLIKLPSEPPSNPDNKPIFMVHPIEGVVDMLRELAARVRGTVYGLQCSRSAPLDDMEALARFYLTHVRAAQPNPPYILLGFSFGASVAFEMALQLEREGHATQLVLVDGSPNYMKALTKHYTDHYHNESNLLARLGMVLYSLNEVEVKNELNKIPDWETRVERLIELITSVAPSEERGALRELVLEVTHRIYRRIKLGDGYLPKVQLQAPVWLITASDSYVRMAEDHELQALCAGPVTVRQLDATHRTILEGEAARTIADQVSELLAQTST